MKTKISKAQEEVWEWKEKAFRNLEEIPEKQRVKYIYSKTKETIDRIRKNKRTLV